MPPLTSSYTTRRWPARCTRRSISPRSRAQPRARAREGARDAGARRRQGERLRARPAARAAGARGSRRPRAGRARRRRSTCASSTTRGASCCSRASSTSASCRRSRSGGSPSSCTTMQQVRMLEKRGAVASARGVRQGQHRHEPAGLSRRARSPACCERLSRSPSVAALRLMMHFARADEDDGIAGAARRVRGGVQGPRRIRARSPTRRA